MVFTKPQPFLNPYCSASMHAIIMVSQLTTTKFAIQNAIKQPCRINSFWFMDYYVTKFEKHPCMILPLVDFYNNK